MRAGERHEGHEAQRDESVTEGHDAAALEAVGDGARDEAECDCGRELREAHEAQVELAVRELVDLPAHGHGGDLSSDGREEAGELEADEIAVREDRVRSGLAQRFT